MNNRFFLVVLALSAITTECVSAESPSRPNIVFFYVDDMGWGAIGPNGQDARLAKGLPSVQTPNLDRLAAQGLNFTRGYGCHVCSPARSSLQTGFHQGHTFADRNDPNNAKKAIRADDPSIGTSLSGAGYITGYWGKWGYGGSKDRDHPVVENVQTLPTSHGFKHVLAELHHVRAHTFFQPTLWSAPAAPNAVGGLELIPNSLARYQHDTTWPDTPALQNHVAYPTTAYCDDAYAFAALDFVRTQGQNYNRTGQPFMGLLAVQIPHAPFDEIVTLPDWAQAYAMDPRFGALAGQSQQWAAMVTRIDAHFGNILAALDDPNHDGDTSDSIADNTLVVFQSDNGGPGGKNNVEFDANGGLSGTKGKIQEGGIRVPLVMRWPEMINAQSELTAGTNCSMVVDVTDLLPTFCELAGAPVPLGIDGVSIAPTLSGQVHQRRREFIIHEAGNGQSIIRGRYKLVRSKSSPLRLFDLDADPTESNDIAAGLPGLVTELESLLLGERVAEPKGFANTYHYWTGNEGGRTSDGDNWSDYKYENAGLTYMEDDGPPQLSWVATIANSGERPKVALADADLELLALEIQGNAEKGVEQTLMLDAGVNLVGRNEVRLGPYSRLTINNGSVSSLRWIEIQTGAELTGHGKINGVVYNDGTVTVVGGDQAILHVAGEYHQFDEAHLSLCPSKSGAATLVVDGQAHLGGELVVAVDPGFSPASGESFSVLTADQIAGQFGNTNSQVVASNGTRFTIRYSDSSVSLIVD